MTRKPQVKKMLDAAREHDVMVDATGPKANSDTNAAHETYRKARAGATDEERALFDRIYK
jgi:hypothetical protein